MAAISTLSPRWMQELHASLPVNPHIVLWGNVHDRVLIPEGEDETHGFRTEPLPTALATLLIEDNSFDLVMVVDPVDGSRALARAPEIEVPSALRLDRSSFSLAGLQSLVEAAATASDLRIAVIIDYAARLATDPSKLDRSEQRFFTACQKLAETALPAYAETKDRPTLYNTIVWLVEGERDLPTWYAMGSEAVRMIPITVPDTTDRSRVARAYATRTWDESDTWDKSETDGFVKLFVDHTDSMTALGMERSVQIALDQGLPPQEIDDAVRAYRFGLPENPWRRPETLNQIANAGQILRERVFGQDLAVDRAVDTLVRSATNLTGAHSKRSAGRPRGVLFFAGPTGVGKTELAKALAELVFGSEDAAIRFDMSEYSSEHAGERLVGSPPGYVGFDAGGQLTGAVQQRPFSLLLFDEIDKAAPRILDKFLQVLEDGRLTDGAGQTVYFSETILVFTTNKGIVNADGSANVDHAYREEHGYDAVAGIVEDAIKEFFFSIQRPELLNRLGENIIVFDFITREVARLILQQKISTIQDRVADEHGIELEISQDALRTLEDIALRDLSNGGRGINNQLEVALINPLAREIFRHMLAKTLTPDMTVDRITETSGSYEVVVR